MHIDYRLGSRSYYYFDPTEGHAQQGTDSENGIYNIATLSKCVILLFSAVFIPLRYEMFLLHFIPIIPQKSIRKGFRLYDCTDIHQ